MNASKQEFIIAKKPKNGPVELGQYHYTESKPGEDLREAAARAIADNVLPPAKGDKMSLVVWPSDDESKEKSYTFIPGSITSADGTEQPAWVSEVATLTAQMAEIEGKLAARPASGRTGNSFFMPSFR
jgi:hypothetical protein